MARVTVYGLGGTISMTATEDGRVAPALSPAQLLAGLPGVSGIDVVDFRKVAGSAVTFADVRALAAEIGSSSADGIVVTQGTDTIEETAYFLDLSVAGNRPVVVTGAMRNPMMAGADGPANLSAAVQVAGSGVPGVVVVFADEIHAAARVRKAHTTGIDAFRSVNGGPLGYVVEGRVRLFNRVPGRTVVPVGDRVPRVALVTAVLDDDGILLEGLGDRVDGIVVAAMGAGHVPERLAAILGSLAERVPVVLTSRTGAGSVLTHTYGFVGSEGDLMDRGLISGGYLDGPKARILLWKLLSAGADAARTRTAFGVAGGYLGVEEWPW